MSARRDSHPAVRVFRDNIAHVRELLNIDRLILDISIRLLEGVQKAHDRQKQPITNPTLRVDKPLTILKNIRVNDSVAPRLQVVRNQAVVLIVSHFTSAARRIFAERLAAGLREDPPAPVAKEALAISPEEILGLGDDPTSGLAEAIMRKKDVSFQDMKSMSRAFKEMLGIEVPRTPFVNDIVVAQACRHAIVHNGGIVDAKLHKQVQGAVPRRLNPGLQLGATIAFTDEEVLSAANSMECHLEALVVMRAV